MTRAEQAQAIRGYLESIGRWHDEFAPAVQQLLDLREAKANALARAQEQPSVKGSQGQPRQNPAWELFAKLQDRTDRLAEALLLTPRAAARAGHSFVAEDDVHNGLAAFLGDDA